MITSRQVRAARALLAWTQEMLADKALVALTALKRLESESGLKVREDTRGQVHRALENAGIVFLASEQGEGVMLVRNPGGARGASRRVGRNMTNSWKHFGDRLTCRSLFEDPFEPAQDAQMQKPPLDPDVDDTAPTDAALTVYDEQHIITYLRLLDADAARADWRKVARIVLHIDPDREPDRARHAFDSHLARAKWMTEHGYRHLLRGGALS
jgi:hypothetical protein